MTDELTDALKALDGRMTNATWLRVYSAWLSSGEHKMLDADTLEYAADEIEEQAARIAALESVVRELIRLTKPLADSPVAVAATSRAEALLKDTPDGS